MAKCVVVLMVVLGAISVLGSPATGNCNHVLKGEPNKFHEKFLIVTLIHRDILPVEGLGQKATRSSRQSLNA